MNIMIGTIAKATWERKKATRSSMKKLTILGAMNAT